MAFIAFAYSPASVLLSALDPFECAWDRSYPKPPIIVKTGTYLFPLFLPLITRPNCYNIIPPGNKVGRKDSSITLTSAPLAIFISIELRYEQVPPPPYSHAESHRSFSSSSGTKSLNPDSSSSGKRHGTNGMRPERHPNRRGRPLIPTRSHRWSGVMRRSTIATYL